MQLSVNNINYQTPQNFTAKFKDSEELSRLTRNEVVHGRYDAYKKALEKLEEVHQGDILDIYQMSDGKTYKIQNQNSGSQGTIDYTGNMVNTVEELARPTSQIHKEVFNCDASSETDKIRKEFYA